MQRQLFMPSNNPYQMKKTFLLLLFVCSLGFLLQHLYFITQGFYFTGDTISYLQDAMRGKALTVFIQANPTWPPATALLFNLFQIVSKSVIIQQQVFVIVMLFANGITFYLLVRKFTESKMMSFTLTIIMLLSSIHSLLFLAAMSESFFILLITASIMLLVSYHENNSEASLLLFGITASLLPMSRYIGIYVLFMYSLYLVVEMIKKRGTTYSYYILCLLLLMWMPFGLYLFRNKIELGVFMESRKMQLPDIHFFELFVKQNIQIISDMGKSIGVVFLLGYCIPWKRKMKPLLFFSFFVLISYEIGMGISRNLFYSNQASLQDNFPSRYMGVIYPLILLIVIVSSSWIMRKLKRIQAFDLAIKAIAIVFLLSIIFSQQQFMKRELYVQLSEVEGADYSLTIKRFCETKNVSARYLLVQETSSNHVARGLKLYCQDIQPLLFVSNISLTKGDIIFTPYKLPNTFFTAVERYSGTKFVYKYEVINDTIFNAEALRRKLHLLD